MGLISHDQIAEEWLETPGAFDAMRRHVRLKEHSSSSIVVTGVTFIQDFLRAWLIAHYPDDASAALVRQVFARAEAMAARRVVR